MPLCDFLLEFIIIKLKQNNRWWARVGPSVTVSTSLILESPMSGFGMGTGMMGGSQRLPPAVTAVANMSLN